MITYSLTEFLLRTGREKLRQFVKCEDFYISKTIKKNQKYCSPQCKRKAKWPREKWNQYIRDRREKERKNLFKKKAEMESNEYEAKIKGVT